MRYRIAVGPQAGRKTMVLRDPSAMADEAPLTKPFTATPQGGQAADSDCATLTLSTTGARSSTGGGTKCW